MNLWDRILTSLQQKINRQSFNTWLKPTQQLAFAEGTLHIEVPSLLFADWISRNYLPLIHESAREFEGSEFRLHFSSRQPGASGRPAIGSPVTSGGVTLSEERMQAESAGSPSLSYGGPAPVRGGSPRPGAFPGTPSQPPLGTGLNPRYSFDSFVVSSCNQFAHAAAAAVAQQPSSAYNPLYIYG